jgi:hypothetical protein
VTATVIFGIVAMILVVVFGVTITVLVSRALSSAFSTLNSMDIRHGKRMEGLLDRFQAIKWEDLAALRSIEDADEGGFMTPTEQRGESGEMRIEEPGRWGALSALNDRLRLSEEERALLEEDFPEDFEDDQARRLRQAQERGVV